MIKVVIGWVLGIFSQVFVDDRNAIVLTRQQLLKIKIFFDKNFQFNGGLKDQHHAGKSHQNLLQEFKCIVDELEHVYAGVFIKIPELTSALQNSLELISAYQENPTLFSDREVKVLIDLKVLWLFSENASPSFDLIKNVLYGGILKRLLNRVRFYCVELRQKMCR